jgi:hypothetical protein
LRNAIHLFCIAGSSIKHPFECHGYRPAAESRWLPSFTVPALAASSFDLSRVLREKALWQTGNLLPACTRVATAPDSTTQHRTQSF